MATPTGFEPTFETPLSRSFLHDSEHQKHLYRSTFRNSFVAANTPINKQITYYIYGLFGRRLIHIVWIYWLFELMASLVDFVPSSRVIAH